MSVKQYVLPLQLKIFLGLFSLSFCKTDNNGIGILALYRIIQHQEFSVFITRKEDILHFLEVTSHFVDFYLLLP